MLDYEDLTENGLWLEESHKGRFTRYAIGLEESAWVDHLTCEVINDPDEVLSEEYEKE